ncbi:MAG TPA: DUF4339 domain-containing protein [Acidimicrobiia bacterium]|nr:DUF4339 domain-containing protein [Acidimicrobiia bacterium]
MTERTWFYLVGSGPVGPVAEPVVRRLASAGHLFTESFVWTDGMAAWTPLGEVDAFEGLARPAPQGHVPPSPDRFADLPAGRSRWAGVAANLGWLSVLLLPAPLAVAAGVTALREILGSEARVGRRLGGTPQAVFGITMGTVFTAVLVWAITAAALR